jgi:hypothetical protein
MNGLCRNSDDFTILSCPEPASVFCETVPADVQFASLAVFEKLEMSHE